jgi:5,10-methylene-tetrahydrofolate dehydrogenase/methenyl tetrahydrofolate cyclohydrolase
MEKPARDPKVLDGKAIAKQVTGEVTSRVQALRQVHGRVPGLAVIIVGSRPDSQTYVRNKRKACEEAGMNSLLFALDANASETELIDLVRRLNSQEDVDGILVQLPLPDHMKSERVLQEIALEKDVDGFHPLNIGRLCLKSPLYPPLAVACTPRGCLELLDRSGIDVDGKHAVVLGRSNVVGLPMALLLLQRNATVTICHSHTADVADQVARADILVAALGRAHFVKGSWIKPGAVVIDVGINSVPDTSTPRGYRLVGDVEYQAAKERAALITPVPGGVGPMTIAMLLWNTLQAFERRLKS